IRRHRPVAHVSWILAEWTFGLNGIRGNNSFYDYFRSRGNKQIDGLACHDRHGLSRKATGNSIFIEVVWYLRGSRISDVRSDADGNGGLKRYTLGFAFTPMQSHVLGSKKSAGAVRCLYLAAIVADIVNSGFRIFCDPVGRGEIRCVIETWSRDRNWNHIEAVPVEEIFAP